MAYFKVLSVVLGLWMVFGGMWAVFSMGSLKRQVEKVYPGERPGWLKVAGALVLVLVLWTWVEFFRVVSLENFVVTLVMSVGLAKVVPMVFFYKKFREFVMALVAEPLAFRVVILSASSIGLALLIMGLFF